MATGDPPYLSSLLERLPERLPADLLLLHLGHFEGEESLPEAQQRMNRVLMERARLESGQRVLDVACGIGGTLAAIDRDHAAMDLVGLNIGEEQLAYAARCVEPRNPLRWVQGDAMDLPFDDGSFDRVLCIEAMFHFASRARFFSEAGRVLVEGGWLSGSDLRVRPGADDQLVDWVVSGLGPWPDPFGVEGGLVELAANAGIRLSVEDVGAAVGPSFARMGGPDPEHCADPGDRGTAALGALLAAGDLEVIYLWGQRE